MQEDICHSSSEYQVFTAGETHADGSPLGRGDNRALADSEDTMGTEVVKGTDGPRWLKDSACTGEVAAEKGSQEVPI